MAEERRVAALVLARGGSKGIPKKNIKVLCGRPLLDWCVKSARDSKVFGTNDIWVSTDSDEIAKVARASGAMVHDRDPATATDGASSESGVYEFLSKHPGIDVLCLIQATSPLVHPDHFREGYARYNASGADSMVSVTREHRFRWSEGVADPTTGDVNPLATRPLNYDPRTRPRRQDWSGELTENGAFYFSNVAKFMAQYQAPGVDPTSRQPFLTGSMAFYEMPQYTVTEIDEPFDWPIVEGLVKRYGYFPPDTHTVSHALAKARLVVFDSDGCLTDGHMYYDAEGEAMKRFFTRDGAGIRLLRNAGIEVGIITGEGTAFTPKRAAKLGITRIQLSTSDKLPVLDAWRQELKLDWDNVVYMGDDWFDVPCIKAAGVGACPANAHAKVIPTADFVCSHPGGKGAVRELCDAIIDAREEVAQTSG